MTQVRRYDVNQIHKFEKTSHGFLKVPGFATRTGVFTYLLGDGTVRRELRHPEDVFDELSLKSLAHIPVTDEHPPEMVTVQNVEKYSKGYTSERAEVIGQEKVETDLYVTHPDLIDKIEKLGKRELSTGYLSDLVQEEGVYNGAAYDYRQKNIRYNHLAVVEQGRAGPEVRLRLDSADAIMQDECMVEKVKIGVDEVEMPLGAANIVKDMMRRYDELKAKVEKHGEKIDMEIEKKDEDLKQAVSPAVPEEQAVPDGESIASKVGPSDTEGPARAAGQDSEEEKKDAEGDKAEELQKKLDQMTAKYDALKAKMDEMEEKKKEDRMDSDTFRLSVRRRVKLEKAAEKLLSSETVEKFDSMNDDELRKAIIKAKSPKADLEGKSSVYLEARCDSITEVLGETESTHKEMGSSVLKTEKFDSASPEEARKRAVNAGREMWKQPLTAVKN